MRCKPDELCVISCTTPATREFSGLLVKTIRLGKAGDFDIEHVRSRYGPWWIVSFCAGHRPRYLNHNENFPTSMGVWPDAWLRPIRHDGSQFDESMFFELKQHARA